MHRVLKLLVPELRHRHVHRHLAGRMGQAGQAGHVPAGLRQHPAADLDDQPRVLSQWHEHARRMDESAGRVGWASAAALRCRPPDLWTRPPGAGTRPTACGRRSLDEVADDLQAPLWSCPPCPDEVLVARMQRLFARFSAMLARPSSDQAAHPAFQQPHQPEGAADGQRRAAPARKGSSAGQQAVWLASGRPARMPKTSRRARDPAVRQACTNLRAIG